MAKPKPTKDDLRKRKLRAKEWRAFMKEALFTEVKLAEVLGISRRDVQYIKAGLVTPHPRTVQRFASLKAMHKGGRVTQ
jgi:predicted transcriptional regulator